MDKYYYHRHPPGLTGFTPITPATPILPSYAHYSESQPRTRKDEKKEKKVKKVKKVRRRDKKSDGVTIIQTSDERNGETLTGLFSSAPPANSHEAMVRERERELNEMLVPAPVPTTIDPQAQFISSAETLEAFQRARAAEERDLENMANRMPPPDETIECGVGSGNAPAGPTAMDLGKWREEELARLAELQHNVAITGEQNYYY